MDTKTIGSAAEGATTVRLGATDFACEVSMRGHTVRADEPREADGSDSGPTPFELLYAALGTCTAITVRMYAKRKGWDLRGVVVRVRRDDGGKSPSPVAAIANEIVLEGDLSDEQRSRLLEIANHCPVHRTLMSPIRVENSLGRG